MTPTSTMRPRSLRSLMMPLSASLTKSPLNSGTTSVKRPLASSGQKSAGPRAMATRASGCQQTGANRSTCWADASHESQDSQGAGGCRRMGRWCGGGARCMCEQAYQDNHRPVSTHG
eukprot:6906075-Prymnesium_polylepis.2